MHNPISFHTMSHRRHLNSNIYVYKFYFNKYNQSLQVYTILYGNNYCKFVGSQSEYSCIAFSLTLKSK